MTDKTGNLAKIYDKLNFGLLWMQPHKPVGFIGDFYDEKYLKKRILELEKEDRLPKWVQHTYLKWEIDRDKRLREDVSATSEQSVRQPVKERSPAEPVSYLQQSNAAEISHTPEESKAEA